MSDDDTAWQPPSSDAPPPPPPPAGSSTPPAPPTGGGAPLPPAPPASPASGGWGTSPAPPPAPPSSFTFAPAPPEHYAGKPPRPKVPIGGWLLLGGAIVMIIGSVLTWVTIGDESFNGFGHWIQLREADDTLYEYDTPAGTFIVFSVILGGFGIALLAAGRVLAVAIIAIIVGAIVSITALAVLAIIQDSDSVELGPGLPVVLIGALATLAGAIVATSKRRRWR